MVSKCRNLVWTGVVARDHTACHPIGKASIGGSLATNSLFIHIGRSPQVVNTGGPVVRDVRVPAG